MNHREPILITKTDATMTIHWPIVNSASQNPHMDNSFGPSWAVLPHMAQKGAGMGNPHKKKIRRCISMPFTGGEPSPDHAAKP
jgi:hypothetical protein